MREIWRILHGARVDVVLNGHIHRYERFAPQDASGSPDRTGPREFIVGTGGDSHASPPTSAAANSHVRDATTFGILRLTLRADGYDWSFVPEAGGSFTDAGSDGCG
jgi:acid phosphatase type 7